MSAYNFDSLFNVLSADELDFEALKRELRPILEAANLAPQIFQNAVRQVVDAGGQLTSVGRALHATDGSIDKIQVALGSSEEGSEKPTSSLVDTLAQITTLQNLESDLLPSLQTAQNAPAVLRAAASKLSEAYDAFELGKWAWNYSAKGSEVESSSLDIVLDAMKQMGIIDLEDLQWICEKIGPAGSVDQERWQKAFEIIDKLPKNEQHAGANAVWQITIESSDEDSSVLKKALDAVDLMAPDEQMGAIKWVCSKLSDDHKLHNEAFGKAVKILETLPEAERFEEAQWIFDRAREGSRAAEQAVKQAFKAIPALSVEAQEQATTWVFNRATVGSTFAGQVEAFQTKLAGREARPQMTFGDFTTKLAR